MSKIFRIFALLKLRTILKRGLADLYNAKVNQ